jgi:hypothetical protein
MMVYGAAAITRLGASTLHNCHGFLLLTDALDGRAYCIFPKERKSRDLTYFQREP